MGDLVSPKRRDVFDRLRRRIEHYRRNHNASLCRYDSLVNGYSDQQRRDQTAHLHQKWLESRNKLKAKNSKANRDTNNQSEQQRNPQLAQTKKRKLDNTQSVDNIGAAESSNFIPAEEPGSPPAKACKTQQGETPTHSVSVNIVQQINTQLEHSQTSEIKLTVSSTVHTGNTSPASGPGGHASASVSTSTNICKQEPPDDTQGSNSSQGSFPDSIGLEDEDLEALLDTLKADGDLPADFDLDFQALRDVDTSSILPEHSDIKKDQKEGEDCAQQNRDFGSGAGDTRNTKEDSNSGMIAEPFYETSNLAGPAQNFNGMGGTGAPAVNGGYSRPPTGPPTAAAAPPMLGDTGPAAETLKQMAAQHQSQESSQYAMKGMPPHFGPDGFPDNLGGHGPGSARYGPYPGAGYAMQNTQQNMYYNHHMAGQMPGGMAASGNDRPPSQHMQAALPSKDSNMVFGATKPLSHFTDPSASSPSSPTTPSSLQQLQNQVQTHFSQAPGSQPGQASAAAPHMQITQSQHLQMSHGNQHMQLSQTQQMQIQGATASAQPISVAQQQSFRVSPSMGSHRPGQHGHPGQVSSQYTNEQIKMQQLYQEKMCREAMEQQQMQSYMNRPPPEYKMPSGAGQANFATANRMANTPLQTMQNMVNQTSQNVNGMYQQPQQQPQQQQGKPEMSRMGPGPGPGQHSMAQMTGMQGSRASPMTHPHTGVPPASQGGSPMPQPHTGIAPASQAGYNHMNQQAVMPGQMPSQPQPMVNGSIPSRPGKAGTPTYTSAIMRGQRPPNVNVGPEGLNITQQRTHPADWPRSMMPQGAQMGQAMHAQQMAQMHRQQVPANMMQYGGYGSQQAMAMTGPRMHMAQQQALANQQHAMRMQVPQSGGAVRPMSHMAHPPESSTSMMMSQQQQMQMQNGQGMAAMSMSQSAAMRAPAPQPHPSHPHSTAAAGPNTGYPTASSSTGPTSSDFSLDFLDNPQTNSTDFFESVVQNSNTSDFNFIDDILGGTRD